MHSILNTFFSTPVLAAIAGIVVLVLAVVLYRRHSVKGKRKEKKPNIQKKFYENSKLFPILISEIEAGHNIKLTLRGYSMRPFLEHDRDVGLLTKPSEPKVGQPVLAEVQPGRYVLHRIVAIEGEDLTLRGDGNYHCEQCKVSDIRAGVLGFYRKGRKKMDSVDGWKWRTYSWVWTHIPLKLRMYMLSFYRRIWLKKFKPI